MKIALIAGHHRAFWYHGRDPGALPTSRVKNKIKRYFPYEPVYNEHHEAEKLVTRTKEAYSGKHKLLICPFRYNLYQKKIWAQLSRVDWIFSIHLNAVGGTDKRATGFELLTYHRDIESVIKAQSICSLVASELGLRNRGVKLRSDLYILQTESHELLFEMGFITNQDDMVQIRDNGVTALLKAIDMMG